MQPQLTNGKKRRERWPPPPPPAPRWTLSATLPLIPTHIFSSLYPSLPSFLSIASAHHRGSRALLLSEHVPAALREDAVAPTHRVLGARDLAQEHGLQEDWRRREYRRVDYAAGGGHDLAHATVDGVGVEDHVEEVEPYATHLATKKTNGNGKIRSVDGHVQRMVWRFKGYYNYRCACYLRMELPKPSRHCQYHLYLRCTGHSNTSLGQLHGTLMSTNPVDPFSTAVSLKRVFDSNSK